MLAVDAPVSGGVGGAEAGTLTFMAGGAPEGIERARPFLAAMGKRVVACGGPGAGQAAKMCNNMILGISMVGIAEAFVLAERLGLDHQALFDVASTSSGQCWALTNHCPVPGPVPASAANRGYRPGFAAALMLKDLTLARDAAESVGADAALGRHARDIFAAFAEGGGAALDYSAVIEAVRGGSRRATRHEASVTSGPGAAQSGDAAGLRRERPRPRRNPDAMPPAETPARRALLIVNEHSRSGRERGDEAEAALAAAGLAVTRGHTESREDVSRRIRELGNEVDLVVVGGGDGTINAAAPGLIDTGLPLGVLPLGTANDLARTLGLPMELDGAVAAIAAGHTPQDRPRRGQRPPLSSTSRASASASTSPMRLTADAKKRWGPLGYAVAGLRVLQAPAGRSTSTSRSAGSATRRAPSTSRSATGGTTAAA